MRYDVAIVGSGPAAISASLNLHLHEKSIVWFGSPELSQKVERSHKIAKVVGEGNVAAHSIVSYLAEKQNSPRSI